MGEDLDKRAWRRGTWEVVKEALTQKIGTWHLQRPPLLVPNQLTGVTVIITGATSGIGLQAARSVSLSPSLIHMHIARTIDKTCHNDNNDSIIHTARIPLFGLTGLSHKKKSLTHSTPQDPLHNYLTRSSYSLGRGVPWFTETPQGISTCILKMRESMHVLTLDPLRRSRSCK